MVDALRQLDIVVGQDGTVTVPAAEIARLGARPGEHLHLVRDEPEEVAFPGRGRVRGALIGKIDEEDLLTDEDFDRARRARVEAMDRKFGPTE